MIKANVGSIDRALRVIVGVGLVAAAATGQVGQWGYLGIVPVLTGAFRFCPAYLPFGINTCRRD